MGFVAQRIGIDLGTSNTILVLKNKGLIISEPTIIIVEQKDEHTPLAVGYDAKVLLGRVTDGVKAIRPLREGVISDFDMTLVLIEYFIRKAIGVSYLVKPTVFLSYPCCISPIELRAVAEATKLAGCRNVILVEKPYLSALGCGLPVTEPDGCMIVDIGGGTTDIAVLSLGGAVLRHSIRVGGMKMDEAIINYIKLEKGILIGDRTAEEIKIDLGAALPLRDPRKARIRGRDTITNLPQMKDVTSEDIYIALHEICLALVDSIKYVLSFTPPDLIGAILHGGITLTGGASLLYGLDQLIASELGIPVLLSESPMDSAAIGLSYLLDDYNSTQRFGQSNCIKMM